MMYDEVLEPTEAVEETPTEEALEAVEESTEELPSESEPAE